MTMPRIRKEPEALAVLDSPPVAVLDIDVDEPPGDPPPAAAAVPAPVAPPPIRTAEPTAPRDPLPQSLPVAAAVIARRTQELAAAEALFVRQESGEALTPDEAELLRYLYQTESDRARQLQRVHRYRSLQRQAGSGADRADAAKVAEETAATLAEEKPVIVAKIAELQQQLTGLETAAADAQAAHDRRVQAADALRDPLLLPEPLHSRFQHARQTWERDYGRPAREARNRAAGMRATAALDPAEDRDQIAVYVQGSKDPRVAGIVHLRFLQTPPDALIRPEDRPRDQRFVTVDRGLWQAHQAELIERADAAEAEALRLESEGQALRAELSEMLESLIPS